MPFAISLSLINLVLYSVQQFGMTLGVGAETVLLVAYLQSMRDGVVDVEEKGFARAVRHVLDLGLFFIIISGLGVIATQYVSGQQATFFSNVFLFKWSLIGIVLFMSLANRGSSLAAGLLQGLAAGTWYALFIVHILAPDAPWLQLGEFYGIWLVGFVLCWTLVVFGLRGKPAGHKSAAPLVKPAVVITPDRTPPPVPKPAPPVVPVAPVAPTPPPPPPVQPAVIIMPTPPPQVPKPVVEISFAPLPTPVAPVMPVTAVPPPPPAPPVTQQASFSGLHVMPKTPEDLAKHKATTV